jgi:Domain of unknown function (DUF6468)
MRNDKQQLEALVRSLDESARRAEAGVATLKQAADNIGRDLQQRLDQGHALRADLSYIIDLGGNLADRLEGNIRAKRSEPKAAAAPGAEAEARPRRRTPVRASEESPPAGERRDPEPPAVVPSDTGRVTGFPSRAERLLRRALEARS